MAAVIASGLIGLLAGVIIGAVVFTPATGYTGPVGEWEEHHE